MAKPAALGTINGRIASNAWIGDKRFGFDGTTLGLVKAALEAGAEPGTAIAANYGGIDKRGAMPYVITATGGGTRTPGGAWADRVR